MVELFFPVFEWGHCLKPRLSQQPPKTVVLEDVLNVRWWTLIQMIRCHTNGQKTENIFPSFLLLSSLSLSLPPHISTFFSLFVPPILPLQIFIKCPLCSTALGSGVLINTLKKCYLCPPHVPNSCREILTQRVSHCSPVGVTVKAHVLGFDREGV